MRPSGPASGCSFSSSATIVLLDGGRQRGAGERAQQLRMIADEVDEPIELASRLLGIGRAGDVEEGAREAGGRGAVSHEPSSSG